MGLLVALSLLVLLASLALTSGFKSRTEGLMAVSLVANALVIGPIYTLGLARVLYRFTLGPLVATLCGAIVAVYILRNGGAAAAAGLGKRVLVTALLPFEGIARAWRVRSLTAFGAAAALLLMPYMLVSAYLAPAWRDWDALWYHESLTGFTIQNHGFGPAAVSPGLQVINGVQRLCEMTQLWFAIWGGRRVVDMANVWFMPLLAASMFALARRYTKDVVAAVAWASALVLFPGFVRLLQSTMVDPQACALLLAAAYFTTHPRLDRRNATYAILGLTLAVGAKIWSIVPVGLLSLVLLVRIIRRRRENGGLATLGLVFGGTAALVGMQAFTYLRNWLNFGNPLWPMIQYDNAKLGIHWKGAIAVDEKASRLNINFNEPFDLFYQKMAAPPFTAMGPGHSWQINDYGFAYAWVVFPLAALAVAWLTIRWLGGSFTVLTRLRTRNPSDEAVASAMTLAVVGGVSLYLSPALHIPRYHVASIGMLAACICWLAGQRPGARLAVGAALVAQLGSVLMLYWAPKKAPYVSVYDPIHLQTWIRTPYPQREVQDVGTKEFPRMLISPVVLETGMAREREVKAGDVVAYDSIEFPALLWNNDYSNRIVWVSSENPLAEAEKQRAVWVYTRGGTTLHQELVKAGSGWEVVGPLEAEQFGSVWRKKR